MRVIWTRAIAVGTPLDLALSCFINGGERGRCVGELGWETPLARTPSTFFFQGRRPSSCPPPLTLRPPVLHLGVLPMLPPIHGSRVKKVGVNSPFSCRIIPGPARPRPARRGGGRFTRP